MSLTLEAGDVLVLYTDGITEGRRDGEQFGEARLEDAVRRHVGGDASLADAILAEALDYQGGRPPTTPPSSRSPSGADRRAAPERVSARS